MNESLVVLSSDDGSVVVLDPPFLAMRTNGSWRELPQGTNVGQFADFFRVLGQEASNLLNEAKVALSASPKKVITRGTIGRQTVRGKLFVSRPAQADDPIYRQGWTVSAMGPSKQENASSTKTPPDGETPEPKA